MSDQGELFQAEVKWFHILREMIMNKDVSKMGTTTFTVYTVIKAFTNFEDGRAFPALETIAEYSGVSRATVERSIKTLVEMGYVAKQRNGLKKVNTYTLREKVQIKDLTGAPVADTAFDYAPNAIVQKALSEIKNMTLTGDFKGGVQVVNIERLYIQNNIMTGDNAQPASVQFNGYTPEQIARLPPDVREMFRKLEARIQDPVDNPQT